MEINDSELRDGELCGSMLEVQRGSCLGVLVNILFPTSRHAVMAIMSASAMIHAQSLEVTNVQAAQKPNTKLVQIQYDLSGSKSLYSIGLRASDDDGVTFQVPTDTLSGDFGSNIAPGTGKTIVWNAGADWNGKYSEKMRFEVTASDVPTVGERFITVQSGDFSMGDDFAEGNSDELPVHSVSLSEFQLAAHEMNFSTWQVVVQWAGANGYTFTNPGTGKGPDHPVQTVSWHDVVKWCNARSEMDGLTPCYRASGTIYRSGETTPEWDTSANGYRLPTEAEWERAARGNFIGKRFPIGNTISHNAANYKAGRLTYESPQGDGFHPIYSTGGYPYTSPSGSFAPNALQLYDMTGNVMEWCWDWYDPGFYAKPEAANRPTGPSSGSVRIIRGGAWSTPANNLRVSYRFASNPTAIGNIGFRLARNP